MDRRERMQSLLVTLKAALADFESGLWTCSPAKVQSYDAIKQTVVAQPTIQGQVRTPDGSWTNTTMPLCLDCPVVFPGGGGISMTFPLAQGDEGLLIFGDRCIDSWWQNGGIQPQAELRMHDLSDGFFLAGVRSQPRKLANVSTASCQLRTDDGQTYIDLAPGKIQLVADELVVHSRNKVAVDAGGTGFVYTPMLITYYTLGVPANTIGPTPPAVPT